MNNVFKNEKEFSVLFFGILLIDILVKLYSPVFYFRYISKPLIVLMLFFYYYSNAKESKKKYYLWMVMALGSFLIGDILIINHTHVLFLGASLFFFSLSKVFLCLRFSHKYDFEVSRLIPFSIIIFIYTVSILTYLYDSLKSFFVPALISFFISLLFFQFAYIRKDVVNKTSYLYVFFGVVIYLISESMMAIKTFKTDIPLQDPLIMLFYGTALYLITLGIVKEKIAKIFINPF